MKHLELGLFVCLSTVQMFEEELRLRRSRLPPEPSPSDPHTILISLKLPNGQRMERRFNSTNQLQARQYTIHSTTTPLITHCELTIWWMVFLERLFYIRLSYIKTVSMVHRAKNITPIRLVWHGSHKFIFWLLHMPYLGLLAQAFSWGICSLASNHSLLRNSFEWWHVYFLQPWAGD